MSVKLDPGINIVQLDGTAIIVVQDGECHVISDTLCFIKYHYEHRPHFKHDCKACKFLANYDGRDLYFCPNEPTVVARYGDKGDEYVSGLGLAETNNHLHLAKELATVRGYLSYVRNDLLQEPRRLHDSQGTV